MIQFLYRFRYFGAFVVLLAATLYGLLSGKLQSGDFATVSTTSFGVLCGAGAATRFAAKKPTQTGANDAAS